MVINLRKWAEKRRAKEQAKYEWHRWFAWYPVQVYCDQYYWLCWIERKRVSSVLERDYWFYSSGESTPLDELKD